MDRSSALPPDGLISSNGTLNIYKFRKSTDEGIYVCLAKHKIGTLASTEISVQMASK